MLLNYIKKLLIKLKWRSTVKKIHLENILNKKYVYVDVKSSELFHALFALLIKTYLGKISIGNFNFFYIPAATINLGQTDENYLKSIGAKSRNMIKKAKKNGYCVKMFDFNEFKDDVYKINISTKIRQGRLMDASYRAYPQDLLYNSTDGFQNETIGVYKEDNLVAYCELHSYENIVIINRLLGHKMHLPAGIMNLLIYEIFNLTKLNKKDFLIYRSMLNNKKNTLASFKKRVGFENYSIQMSPNERI